MIFRHSGVPKKSVFVGAFGSSRKLCAERGDGVPNVALYQTEPHLVINLLRLSMRLSSEKPVGVSASRFPRVRSVALCDACHSLALPSSATGSGRARPQTEPHLVINLLRLSVLLSI